MTTGVSPKSKPVTVGEMVGWLAAAWFCSMMCGVVLLRGTNDLGSGNPVAFDRAVLVSVSTATLTGFRHDFVSFEQFGPVVKTMLALETFFGFALATIGGGLGLNRALGRPHRDGAVAFAAITIGLIAVAVGWLGVEGQSGLNALSVAAGSNAWFSRLTPTMTNLAGVVLPATLLGTLGPVVWLDLLAAARGRKELTTHTRQTLTVLATAFLVGSACVAACVMAEAKFTLRALDDPKGATAMTAAANVIVGGVGMAATELPRAVPWVLVALAIVGLGTAGTGGGAGWAWRWTGGFSESAKRKVKRAVAVQLTVTFAGLLYLLTTQTQIPADRMLLIVVGAAFNAGVTTQPLSAQGDAAFVLSVLMVVGRVLPVVLVWRLATARTLDIKGSE